MKKLSDYIREEVSVSIGDHVAGSLNSTPANTMGMGDVKPPSPENVGSGDKFGITRKSKKKRKAN
jgi:hypothetical protein